MSIDMKRTERGFVRGDFTDRYGEKCSIQKSSLATEDAIWLGTEGRISIMSKGVGWHDFHLPDGAVNHSRMHLTQEQVRDLIVLLQHFVDYGELPEATP